VAMLIQQKAAADLRATQIPATAEAYEAKLPDGFKLPDGMAWQFDTNSPAYIDARNWAHRNGLSQNQWSEALSFFASTQVAEHNLMANAAAAEAAKLGNNAVARVSAVEQFLRGHLGDDHGRSGRHARARGAADAPCGRHGGRQERRHRAGIRTGAMLDLG
jgi:hypothetical protein